MDNVMLEEVETTITQGIASEEIVLPEITAVVDLADIKTVLVATAPPEPTTVPEAVVNSPHREVWATVEEAIAVEEAVDVKKLRKSSVAVT
ncbi:hypothetical protein WDU94_009436 [Cyamophila willieti]